MIPGVRFDVMGSIDILSALLVLTVNSPIPEQVLLIHASFLSIKGASTMLKPVKLPGKAFIIGGMADLFSAVILFTGTTPVIAGTPLEAISLILMLKGTWTLANLL